MDTHSQWSKQEACFACATQVWQSLSILTPVSLIANEFDVPSVLHGQVSLAAANSFCVFHEALNGCKS